MIIARWPAYVPRGLVLNAATRGIDIGAKNDLYALFGALAAEGLAVVMLSTEPGAQGAPLECARGFSGGARGRVLRRAGRGLRWRLGARSPRPPWRPSRSPPARPSSG